MSEGSSNDSNFPDQYPDASGKGDLHIPGAGTIGMVLLIASLSMLFIASMVAFMVIRIGAGAHWGVGMPHVPRSLWISTVVILLASVTIQKAFSAIRRDDERGLARYLLITFFIGALFLALQMFNWIEFYRAILDPTRLEGPYLTMFYVLTGLHAAHVIGGLIPLGFVWYRARRGHYSRNFHPGVRYSTIYWHFLDVIWVVLFCLMYF